MYKETRHRTALTEQRVEMFGQRGERKRRTQRGRHKNKDSKNLHHGDKIV